MDRKQMYDSQMKKCDKEKMWDSIKFYFAFSNFLPSPKWEETPEGLADKQNGRIFVFCDEMSNKEIKTVVKGLVNKYKQTVLCTLDRTKGRELRSISSRCGMFMYADAYGLGMNFTVKL